MTQTHEPLANPERFTWTLLRMNTSIPAYDHADIKRDARGVYTLCIVRAKSLNILGTSVLHGLSRALAWIAEQPDARALILRGSGEKAFVAGADIYEMRTLHSESARRFITDVRQLCDAVRAIPVPTIARIPGYCLGAGMELAAACDIRLGSDKAVVGMPEVRLGLPSVVQAALLPALIGIGATNWLLLTGENVDAKQAQTWGFLQFVSSADDLDALVEHSVAAIVASGPRAVRSQKQLLHYWEHADLEAAMDRSVTYFGDAFLHDEPARYMAPSAPRRF